MTKARPRRVLGIDPGTLRLGFAVLEERSAATPLLLASGVLSASPARAASDRLGTFFRELEAVVAEHQPSEMALESSFFGENARSLLRLGEARGCALSIAGLHDLRVRDYPPASVKKAITGHGNASKAQLARLLARLLPELSAGGRLGPLDRTDAIAVAWCHLIETRGARCSVAPIVGDRGVSGGRNAAAATTVRNGQASSPPPPTRSESQRLVEAWRRRRRR
jgi:crossover junction endodeoxyribonuclease RuvC